jgi:hypothetical protein
MVMAALEIFTASLLSVPARDFPEIPSVSGDAPGFSGSVNDPA